MRLIKVTQVGDVPSSQGKVLSVGDKQIALFNLNGTFHAIDNTCPHRGGPLGEGDLEGTVVTCPWHRWQFDVTTGKSPVNPAACVKTYVCKVEGADILIQVP